MRRNQNLNFSLKLISEDDLNNLRNWKNSNRENFHFKDNITLAMHTTWYLEYIKRYERKQDFMFIVKYLEVSIGCLGFRKIEDSWDGYNVIRGEVLPGTKGFMSQAFLESIKIAWDIAPLPFQVNVLNYNPAITWYLKCGFKIVNKDKLSTLLVKKYISNN